MKVGNIITNKDIGIVKRIAKSSFKKLVKEYPTLHENYGQSVITKVMNKTSEKLTGSEMTYKNKCDMKDELIEFNELVQLYLMKYGQDETLELIKENTFFDNVNFGLHI